MPILENPYLDFDEATHPGITHITFKTRKVLDETVIQKIGQALQKIVDGPRLIAFDFEGLEYCSTATFGKFITLQKNAKVAEAHVVYCNVNPAIYETFKMIKLNKVLTIRDTLEEALNSLRSTHQ